MQHMSEKENTTVNKILDQKVKIYYQLNQLEKITGLSIRSLKYRMKLVKEKYKDKPVLLQKAGREWRIHYTLISDFLPKYNLSKRTDFNEAWKTFFTWNLKESYDREYHINLIKEIKQLLSGFKLSYVIEKDQRWVNHLHAITDASEEVVEQVTEKVLSQYLNEDCYRHKVEKILDKGCVVTYLKKCGELKYIQ